MENLRASLLLIVHLNEGKVEGFDLAKASLESCKEKFLIVTGIYFVVDTINIINNAMTEEKGQMMPMIHIALNVLMEFQRDPMVMVT